MKYFSFPQIRQRSIKNAVRILLLLLAAYAVQTAPAMADILTTEKISGVEVDIRRPENGIHPLIIFSHGMGKCPADYAGIQSRLADAGYMVVAPKHADCTSGSTRPDTPWRQPEKWTAQTNRNRRDDIHRVLDALPSHPDAQYIKSFKQVGCAGHSMGGYTCMGLAGAWESWKRNEVIAVALLSPWHQPYAVQKRIANMRHVTTLYQGGTKDRPISTELIKPNGTFYQTAPAKYLQIFKRARHSSWTDGRLAKRFHQQMSDYLVSFFDVSFKKGAKQKLEVRKSQVSELQFVH